VKIQVKVKPNSKQQSITEEADGSLTIKLKSSPVEGKESGDGYMSHISSCGPEYSYPGAKANKHIKYLGYV
jgi:hypothetical protein